jgi:hypothetical protein
VDNTLTNGLAICSTCDFTINDQNYDAHRKVAQTLGDGLLAVTTTDTNTIDDIALLGLVSETPGLVGSRWARGAVDDVQLTILPASNIYMNYGLRTAGLLCSPHA